MLKNGRCTMLYIYRYIVTYYDERDNKHAQQQKSSSSCTYATAWRGPHGGHRTHNSVYWQKYLATTQ